MSDELASELGSDLRELAASGETPPPVSGAGIRLRAVRRRRRRRTAVTVSVAGACAAASLALLLALHLGDGGTRERPSPAASHTAPSRTPVAVGATVDLARRVLTAAGRDMPVSAGMPGRPTPTGRMTVVAKRDVRVVPALEVGPKDVYALKVPWVIELRAADGTTNFVGALSADQKAPGNYDVTDGWIGLRSADAQWLYGQLDLGAVVEIVEIGDTVSGPSEAAVDTVPPATGGTDARPSSGRQPAATAIPSR
ncbi:L,D-transpeptidase [Streptomyces sp. NPDC051639]|uniref:L,D-transpeptidase n=1 Tax=Streptomyces sp. NPDC051639 TaxID=3155671 RepID=UPI00341F0C06